MASSCIFHWGLNYELAPQQTYRKTQPEMVEPDNTIAVSLPDTGNSDVTVHIAGAAFVAVAGTEMGTRLTDRA